MGYATGSINADLNESNKENGKRMFVSYILKDELKWWVNHRKALEIELYEK